jgi:N-acetylmuramoyl-L-alanine amidase
MERPGLSGPCFCGVEVGATRIHQFDHFSFVRIDQTNPMQEFAPDFRLAQQVRPSPNHDERMLAADILLLHYTGMTSTAAAIERLCDPAAKVSSHYVVNEDGNVLQLVPEARRAWHAGLSSWNGVSDINSRSIGIEIANPGHSYGYPDFPEPQIAAVIALCSDIVKRRRIRAERVLAHSDVAPRRKRDPGEKFPWARLYRAGVGAWVTPSPIRPGTRLARGDSGPDVAEMQAALRRYGYGIEATGVYDDLTEAVVTAFQRHFRVGCIDGRADQSTVETLRTLLAASDRARSVDE